MNEHVDLEARVHGALQGLPAPRAPHTLFPRVMAAVARSPLGRPWYERAWFTWPLGWRVASSLALAVPMVALTIWWPDLQDAQGRPLALAGGEWLDRLSKLVAQAAATLGAADLLRRVVLAPVVGCLMVLAALTSTTCAAAGAVLLRVTSERMSSS